MTFITTLVASIDERLSQITDELDALTRTRAALNATTQANGGHATPGRPAGATAARSAAPRRRVRPGAGASRPASASVPAAGQKKAASGRRRRATTTLSTDQLSQLLAQHPAGLSARTAAAQAGAGYPATLALLRTLEASGQVRREGVRRATVWRLVTDEERIAARAAELAKAASAPASRTPRRRARARSTA
jgi:hypothetical protein